MKRSIMGPESAPASSSMRSPDWSASTPLTGIAGPVDGAAGSGARMRLMVADNYGPEQRLLNDRFCTATGIPRTDYVLDACVAPGGRTARDAARAAVADEVLGADVARRRRW